MEFIRKNFGKLIASSINRNYQLNLQHTQMLNPTLAALADKPVRGSDVPLFHRDKDGEALGARLKKTYNDCINLITYAFAYAPIQDEYSTVILEELEERAIQQMKILKKKKKDYSNIWKNNFKKYQHHLVIPKGATTEEEVERQRKISYDETDPYDGKWMNHELLEHSEEMEKAARDYFRTAKEVLEVLIYTLKTTQRVVEELCGENDFDRMITAGRIQNEKHLKVIQNQVDAILSEEWGKIEKYFTGVFEGIQPSYIGSTHTGQKSITKAYIQFNPRDYDVDGQLVSTELYLAISHFYQTVSKGRFFVREAADQVIKGIAITLNGKGHYNKREFSEEAKTYLKTLRDIMNALRKYVNNVERKLIKLPGIQEDPNDKFDLAIIRNDEAAIHQEYKEMIEGILNGEQEGEGTEAEAEV